MTAFTGLFMSCATTSYFSPGIGNKYQYTYALIPSEKNSNLLFLDDSVIIQFKVDEAAIQFQLQNISESKVTLDWGRASISINGRYFAVRHAANFYVDTIHASSILIPPLGYLHDAAIPRDNIYYDGSNWVELDLLPTTDHRSLPLRESIQNSAGQRMSLMLPIIFGSTAKNYKFDFQVESIKRIAWKDYLPYKRIPAPPSSRHPATVMDNVTAAAIAVGVLGFSTYILSMKKNPPTE
jgi:hypothetical protein